MGYVNAYAILSKSSAGRGKRKETKEKEREKTEWGERAEEKTTFLN
jgi:hypothetical protein